MSFRPVMTAYLLMLVTAANVFAAKTAELKFTKQTDLPNIGLSIKLMSNAKATPLPPATVITYTIVDQNGASQKRIRHDPWILWYKTQHSGRWTDPHNNALSLAKITLPRLHNIEAEAVSKANFKSIIDATYTEPIKWTNEKLLSWVKDFTRSENVKSERITTTSSKIKDVTRILLDDDTTQMSYVFKLNTPAKGQTKASDNYFFFHVQLAEGADPNTPARMLHGDFIMELMESAKPTPLLPPAIMTEENEASWKELQYEPWGLWRRTQSAGKWTDQQTNTLSLAEITFPRPRNIEAKNISKARFNNLMATTYTEPIKWTNEKLRSWVKDFTRSENVTSERMTISSFKIKDVVRFHIDNDPFRMAYAFKLNPAATEQSKVSSDYYFFIVELARTADPKKASKALHDNFIKNIQISKTKGTETRTASRMFQVRKQTSLLTRRNAPERSAEFIESRKQVASSIKNLKDWWFVNTENYIILSNLSIKHKVMVKELQSDIEYLRKAYAKIIPPRKAISAVSVLRVFATPQEYLAYVGAKHQWSGGLWMPSKKEMIIRPIDWGKSKDQRARVKRVTYHEAFHQYLHYALDQSHTSVWFNEGHAEFFETAVIKNKKLEIKEDEYKAEELIKMIAANKADTQALLQMSYKDFYGGSDEKRGENYTLAWGIVYYLRKGAKFDKPASHTKLLDNYVDALWKTKDPVQATAIAFSATNPHKFQKDFISFWTSKTKRSLARRNKIFK